MSSKWEHINNSRLLERNRRNGNRLNGPCDSKVSNQYLNSPFVPLLRELSSLCLSLPPSFIPLSSTHLTHPQPTLWGHLSLSAELWESFVQVCVCVYVSLWVSEWVCVSGLLISLGCCRFKLFIPTAPAHTHSHTCTSPSHACPHPPAREAVSVATLSKIADFSSRNEIKGEIGCISIRGGSLELNTHPWSRPLRFSFVFLTLPPPPTHSSYLACLIVLSLFFYIYLFFLIPYPPPFSRFLFLPGSGGRENETKKEIDLVWMTFDPFRASKQYVVTWETGHGDVRGDCLTGDLISCGTGGSFPAFCKGLFWQTLSGP